MPKALSNSQLMNQIIRRGKTPQPQQEETTELSPETVIADVKALAAQLPERELDAFREAVIAVLYGEDDAEATA